MLNLLNNSIGFLFIVIVLLLGGCTIVYFSDMKKETLKNKYWQDEKAKAKEYFSKAEAECTVTEDDICNNKCGECDIDGYCPMNKRG